MIKENKIKKIRYETVSIKKEVSSKIDLLMESIDRNTNHIKVSRGQIINYLLLNSNTDFNKKEFQKIEQEFYDLEDIMSEATKKIREAKKHGGMISLADVLPEALFKKPRKNKTTKKAKAAPEKATTDKVTVAAEHHSGGDLKEGFPHENNKD